MNESELEELLGDCPKLFHMAERGSWESIKKYGLQSTSALLDRYRIDGERRLALEAQRRPVSVALEDTEMGRSVIRDQFPMDDKGLTRSLQGGLTPESWYRLLNEKVFFWLTRDRLLRLLGAGTYRESEHDVLEIDARMLVQKYRPSIWLCPINSGCTKPYPAPRGIDSFQRIESYPYSHWRSRRKRGERAVELAVDYSVPDIESFVTRVIRMKGALELTAISK